MVNIEISDELNLKWGTLKGWNFPDNKKAQELLKEYHKLGFALGCAQQVDTPRQKEIILELIDVCQDPKGIYLDWDGKYVTKEEAKEYILSYRKNTWY